MHDNTWARSLMQAGHEVSLIPTYTPIRVDDHNESQDKVFFGGINVYLNQKIPGWKYLPRAMTRWLDRPGFIQWATKRSVSNNAEDLGPLTISMVKGESGPHRAAIRELDEYISDHLNPDVVIFSNALLVGAVRELKKRFSGPVLCVLQGDDVFLDGLKPEFRKTVIELISERATEFDGFLVHSHFYKEYISNYLQLPIEKFSVIPLGIDFTGHDGTPTHSQQRDFTIGYFARIAPEKGLHHLIDGFVELKSQCPEARLRIGGYLGPQFQEYLDETLATAKLYRDSIEYVGSPETSAEKVDFLKSLDVLSVPTEFLEPKGLYVLEAMANGIPVVQPRHGSFPELIEMTNGGLLVEPKNPTALAAGLLELTDQQRRFEHAQHGWQKVRDHYSPEAMTEATIKVAEKFLLEKKLG